MASTDSKKKSTCPVCELSPQDPKLLQCGHAICAPCLQQHISASPGRSQKSCPKCEETNKEPELQSNSTMARSVTGGGTLACVNPGHGPATTFCKECDKFYCTACSDAHSNFELLTDHKVRPIDDELGDGGSLSIETCPTHEHQELDAYCKTCKTPVCMKCTSDGHKDHWHQSFADAFKEAQTTLDDIIAKAIGYIMKRRDRLLETDQTKESVQSTFKTVKDGIQLTAGQMRDIISCHENQILDKLEHQEKEILAKLDKVHQQLEKQRLTAFSLKQGAEVFRHPNKARESVQHTPTVQKQFEEMRRLKEEYVTWKFDIGKIHQTEKKLRALLGGVDLKTTAKETPERFLLRRSVNEVTLSSKSKNQVTGMVVTGQCLAVLLEEKDLLLCDMETGYMRKCPDLDLQSACGMALLEPAGRTMVIAAPKQLVFVQISEELDVTVLGKKTVEMSNPTSISVSEGKGELVVGDRKPCIYVYNEEGGVQNCIDVTKQPYCVKQNEDGFVILREHPLLENTSMISWVDEKGNEISQYQTEEKNIVTTSTKQIVQDKEGNVIFAERDKNRVEVVKPNGRFAQHLLTKNDGIKNPEYVYLDEETSQLYVVHQPSEFKEVLVYRWSSKCGDSLTTNYKLEAQIGKFQYYYEHM